MTLKVNEYHTTTEYRPEPKPESERGPNIWPYVQMTVTISAAVFAVWVTGAVLLFFGKKLNKWLKARKNRKNQENLLKLEYDDKENH